MKGIFPIDKFRTLQTPFYYYDTKVLRDTLSAINHEVAKYPNYSVHYAVKANANPKVLTIIRESGMGAETPLLDVYPYSAEPNDKPEFDPSKA